MTDLATLAIKVDSSQVPKAAGDLDKLTAAGTRAEGSAIRMTAAEYKAIGAIEQFARSTNTAGATASKMAADAQRAAHGLGSFGNSANNARIVALELTHVTRNLGTQLAIGVDPLRAFTSELGRLSTAAQYAGGIGGLARMIAAALAPFAALAAAVGTLGLAFIGVKQAADAVDLQPFINSLGLTDKEMKKLTDTTVTWGDVGRATFQVLAEKAGTSSDQITGFFSRAFRSIGEFGKFSAAIILAAFGAAVKGTADVVLRLPDLVGGAIVGAANLAIAAVEKMVNLSIAGLNKVSGFINGIFGTHLGQIAEVSLGRVGEGFVGLGDTVKAMGADVSGTFYGIYNRTQATFDAISARAVKLREDNIRSQADEIIADRNGAAAKAAHTKALRDHNKALKDQIDLLDKLLAMPVPLDRDLLNVKAQSRLDGSIEDVIRRLPGIPEVPQTPFQKWAETIPQTADDINRALQSIEVRGFDSLASAIANVVTGTESLGQAFKDVARSIISDIIQMTIRMLIFRAVSSALGGGFSQSDFAATEQANFAALGVPPRASGGPVSAGMTYLIGEKGPELFRPAAPGMVIPNNRLAANNNQSGPIEVHVVVDAAPELDVRIATVSAKVVGAAAPRIIDAAVTKTVRSTQRPRLNGGR